MDNTFVTATSTLLTLLLIAALLKPVENRSHIPFPVLLVFAGLGLELISAHWQVPWTELSEVSVFKELIMVILLPTMVFETALSLDCKQLLENYKAILYLAIPGLLISAGIITLIVGTLTGINWTVALLLGIILSATDPVAVIDEFRRLGTPKDLTLLVEGESLFNDATTIVLTKIVIVILGTGVALNQVVVEGILHFFTALVGGILNGWIFGRICYFLLIQLRRDPFVEITLTLLLAYGSYLTAEFFFHTSGIIATAVAGLVLARERPLPIPHRVEQQLNNFWSFLAYAATTIIFLMIGLATKPDFLIQELDIAVIVIIAMIISRSTMIYGLMPIAGKLSRHPSKIRMAYRHILNWGGLRGAVTLALAMGLSGLAGMEQLFSITLVAVLFSIIVQGLSIGRLTHALKLDIPDISDKIAQAESWLSAKNNAKKQLINLQNTPFALLDIPEDYKQSLDQEISGLRYQLSHWRSEEEGPIEEWKRFVIRGLTIEISYTYDLLNQGLLPTKNYIQLRRCIKDQIEALRHDQSRPESLLERLSPLRQFLLGKLPFTYSTEMFAARDYLTAWARRLSSDHAIRSLESLMELDHADDTVRQGVLKIYHGWHEATRQQLRSIEDLFPGVVTEQQHLLVRRLILTAQIQDIQQQAKTGLITESDADSMVEQLSELLEQNTVNNN